jgi:hypothetical protein
MLDNPDVDAKPTIDMASNESDFVGLQLIDLLARRCSVPPPRLTEPGPNPNEVQKLLLPCKSS